MKTRKNPALSFTATDWALLRKVLERDDSREAAVLYVQMCTGVRIGDVLRVERSKLNAALKREDGSFELIQKGGSKRTIFVSGASEAWTRLAGVCDHATVAESVCPTSAWGARGGGGAYKRVYRHLRGLTAELALEGRGHTHRLRRTVATRALGATKDVHLVSQLLGHRSIRSTEQYVDEIRSGEVAELQKRLMAAR